MPSYRAAWRATQGARSYQEDTAIIRPGSPLPDLAPDALGPDRLIAVLADGMGGHAGGAIASRTVCECFVWACAESKGPWRERLWSALEVANAAIARAVASNPALTGMGSTLIGAAFGPEGLQWVSVGDSPLYLLRRGKIALLNEDHSLAPLLDQLAAEGVITFEQAWNDPRRHVLRSAVTGGELELVDLSPTPLPIEPGDCVILASDGIHTLEPSEIARIVAARGNDGPDAIATALIRAVETVHDPHQDNATVVIVQQAGS
jgi:serine/threonine protein phosphatase PrpC